MKKYLIVILIILSFSGCEEYFDKEPQGNPTTDEFYGSLNELKLGVNAIYNVVADNTWQKSEWLFGSGASDECNRTDAISLYSPEGEIMQHTYTAENIWLLKRWETNYRGVFRANWVIANADKVTIFENNEDAVNDLYDLLGQAKFFRGFFYFNLVKSFGGVPVKPEVLSIDETEGDNFVQPRSTVEELYEYIEKDLREAALLLRSTLDFDNIKEEQGKVTRGAALSLLAKVLAYQATPGVNHEKWKEALTFTSHLVDYTPLSVGDILNQEVLYPDESLEEISQRLLLRETLNRDELITNDYSYELSEDYDLLWHQAGETSKEWIFYVNHRETQDGSASVGSGFSEDLTGYSGWAATLMQPSEYLFGLNGGDDPRLRTSVISQERIIYTGTLDGVIYTTRVGGGHPGPTKTNCHKWITLTFEQPQNEADNGKNFRILRFAEIKLFHAEALNETGNPQAAVDQLNQLRERSHLIDQDRWPDTNILSGANEISYGTYPEVRDKIWTERQIELNCEFDRFWDIVRTKRAKKEIDKMNSKIGDPSFTVDFIPGVNEIFAIPQNEIDLSNGVVTQNPGY